MKRFSAVLHLQNQEYRPRASYTPHSSQDTNSFPESDYDRLKNEFFNNISHELRTPINVILGSIQLFEIMGDDLFLEANREKFNLYHRIMKQNCFRLLRLINNLIDVTKMDTGKISLYPQNHNMISMVHDILLNALQYAEAKGLSFNFHTDEREIIVACDGDKIQRVLLNLLSNAIKFTPKGGQITVSLRQDDRRVYLSVKDTGIGISPEKLNNIFERFNPEDNTLTRNHEGSGIGLALSSSIIRLHGGLIRVNSIPKRGSEFIIELPNRRMIEDSNEKNGGSELNLSSSERVTLELSDLI